MGANDKRRQTKQMTPLERNNNIYCMCQALATGMESSSRSEPNGFKKRMDVQIDVIISELQKIQKLLNLIKKFSSWNYCSNGDGEVGKCGPSYAKLVKKEL